MTREEQSRTPLLAEASRSRSLIRPAFCLLQIFTRFGKVLKIVTFTKNSKYSVRPIVVA